MKTSKSLLFLLPLSLGLSLNAMATSETWNGGGDGITWESAPNWGGASFPGAATGTTDIATFNTAAGITTLGASSLEIGEIVTGGSGNNVTIGDAVHTLTLNSSSLIAMGGDNLTLNVNTTLAKSGSFAVGNGILTLGSGFTLSVGSKLLTITGANETTFLNGTTSGTGTIAIQAGTVNIGSSGGVSNIAFGATAKESASLFISTTGVSNSSNLALIAQTGTGTSSFIIGSNITGGGTGTFTGGLNLTNGTAGSAVITLSAAASNTVTFAGPISGSNASATSGSSISLATSGAGIVILSGTNNYTAATTINSGATLEFANVLSTSATSTVTASSGGTLAVAVGGANQFTTTGTGTGTLAGILNGVGGQTGSVVSFSAGSSVGIDTGATSQTYSNDITNSGIGLTKLGTGTLTLSGNNIYGGPTVGTTVSAGGLILANTAGSATGTSTLSVGAGATIGGTGTSSGTGFSISGTGTTPSTRANVLVGISSATDTNTSSVLTLIASGASTIQNANLTFNLNTQVHGALGSSPTNSGTVLSVAGTNIAFGTGTGSVQFTLNMENEPAIVPANTPYVLIAGTGATSDTGGVSGGQYSGLTLGTVTNLGGGSTETLITGGNLALLYSNPTDQAFYANSFLVLYQSAGVDDIEVEVVPEPGTWAMMLGGLAGLIFWQRRKSKRA